jgi:hypothetical protein
VIGRGDGVARYMARGSLMWFKALAEQDGGDLSVMERTLPPRGRRPPPHRHTNCSEAYFAELHELWNREVPPSPDEERALMARFGMVPAS